MLKKLFLLSILVVGTTCGFLAQKEVKYVKILYKDNVIETKDFDIKIENVVSSNAETKFKLKITNKTKDFFIYKPNESKLIIDGKEYQPNEKEMLIEPYESNFRVINIKGTGFNAIKTYSVEIDGIYKFIANESNIKAADFKLPPSQNDFEAGNYTCTMVNLSKESGGTYVKFDCRYNGDKMGLISVNKPSVLMPDGNLYATAKTKDKYILFKKGESKSIGLKWDRMEGGSKMDMQKVEMMIKWNETFSESNVSKVKGEKTEISWDEELTNLKGK